MQKEKLSQTRRLRSLSATSRRLKAQKTGYTVRKNRRSQIAQRRYFPYAGKLIVNEVRKENDGGTDQTDT